MKSSLKIFIALLLTFATIALVACGGDDITTGPEGTTPPVTTGPNNPSNPGEGTPDGDDPVVSVADEFTLTPGKTIELKADITVSAWMSSDSVVASVDNKGKVKAVSPGVATIKGKAATGESVNYIINVYDFKISYDEEAEEPTECVLVAVEGSAHELTIPKEIKGLKVVELGANAVENFVRLRTLTFEEGCEIKTVGNDAFKGCSLLETVTLPESVEEIGSATFAFCTNLKSFAIPSKVTAISDGMFYGCTSLTSYTVPAHVTAIGKYAFAQCPGITEFNVPDNVTSVGVRLFYYSTNLKKVTFGSGVTAIGDGTFLGCAKLTDVTLPANLESIGTYAFAECSAISNINIPATVTTIGNRAFWNCAKIQSITLPESLTAVSKGMLSGTSIKSITLPASVTSIGAYAFDNCASLATVTVNGKLDLIDEGAFRGCNAITAIDLSKGIVAIGVNAFEDCTKLATVALSADIATVGNGAFKNTALSAFTAGDSLISVGKDALLGTPWYNSQADGLVYIGKLLYNYKGTMPENTKLEIKDGTLYISESALASNRNLISVVLPASVTRIGFNAFGANPRLAEITLPFIGDGGEENLHLSYVFGGENLEANATALPKSLLKINYIGKVVPANAFNGCLLVEEVALPAAESIELAAFYGCTGLKTVEFGTALKTVGETAFYGCKALTEITLGDSVTEIGIGAFQECSAVEKLTIGKGLKTIAESAFADCTSLVTLTIADGVEEIGKEAFKMCTKLETINLPDSVYNVGDSAFHNTKWHGDLESGKLAYIGKVLYSVNGASDTTLTIKDGTVGVAFGAASGMATIDKLVLPDTLKYIGAEAFKGIGIKELVLGPSVKGLGEGAFADCATLNDITYYQTPEAQANAIYSVVDTVRFGGATVNYVLKADDYTVKFENNGYTIVKYKGTATELDVIAEYNDGTNGWKPVLAVADSAFEGNTALTSVNFTSDIVSIGKNAFKGCTGLVDRFTIPTSVTSIGDSAFEGCSNLGSISLNSETLTVGKAIFKDCSSLSTTIIGAGLTEITESMFENCTKLSVARAANATSVGKNAYKGCEALTTVAFTKTTVIGESAFEGCAKISSLTLGNTIETISKNAFKNCTALASLTIPNGTKTIGESAFEGCIAITRITIPASVTAIGDYAFKGCSAATNLTVNGTGDNGTYTIGKYAFEGCAGLTTVSVSKGYATISEGMFKGCAGIKTFSVVASVKTIEAGAFEGCTALEKVIFYRHNVENLDGYKANGGKVADNAFPAGFTNFEFTN